MEKKRLCLLWILGINLLTGCGSDKAEVQNGNSVESEIVKTTEETESCIISEKCGEENKNMPEFGFWDHVTFTNLWANIKMTIPENAIIFMREQFPLFVTVKDNQIWDTILMLNDGDSSIYIFYEKKEKNISLDDFLQQKFAELKAPEGLQNQINNWTTVTIGTETYRKLETSIRNDKFTDFYAREKDGYFIIIQTTATPFKVEEMRDIMETIVPANENNEVS